jgi:hypothetical protein
MLGKSTGDSIYSGLGHAKFGVLQRDAPNKSLEWIEQWCNDTSFCFQQANWVNSANKSYLRKASEAKQLADGWADKFRDLVADVDRLNYELSMVEKNAPNHPSVIEAKRELYSAKVTLNVFGFNEAEAIVKKAAVMVSTVTDKGFLA